MDLYGLQTALTEISQFFWGPEVEAVLRASGYPVGTPQESAYYRYMVARRREEDASQITQCVNRIKESLYPHDKTVWSRLAQVADGPIPLGQLATFSGRVKDFDGISRDNYREVVELIVCLAHPQFLAGLDRYIETGGDHRKIVGDTIDMHGVSLNWRNARTWFGRLPRWKKAIAILVAVVVLAIYTRSTWLPLVCQHFSIDDGEQKTRSLEPADP